MGSSAIFRITVSSLNAASAIIQKGNKTLLSVQVIIVTKLSSLRLLSSNSKFTFLPDTKCNVFVLRGFGQLFLTCMLCLITNEMLLFWLTRVRTAYNHYNKPIPPILLLFMWKQDIGFKSDEHILEQGHGHDRYPAYAKSMQILEDHQRLYGMEFHVIDVAALIPTDVFLAHRRAILDDRHHPGCIGSHLIATTIQYAIYSSLLGLGESSSSLPTVSNTTYTQHVRTHARLNTSARKTYVLDTCVHKHIFKYIFI